MKHAIPMIPVTSPHNTTSSESSRRLHAPELAAAMYKELRMIARRCLLSDNRHQHAAQKNHNAVFRPTALVHECYLKLANAQEHSVSGRSHFLALSARIMRQILIDEERKRSAAKRGGGLHRITLSGIADHDTVVDVAAINEALATLDTLHPRQCKVVEYRTFGGMTFEEIATQLDVSEKTARLDWRMAKAWLADRLNNDKQP